MELKDLIKRGVEIRKQYAELEKYKQGKSWTRLNLMEGFVGDVGDLMKLVMAKEGVRSGEDVDNRLKHELADCLWSVVILANVYGIDLEDTFLETMDGLEERIKKLRE